MNILITGATGFVGSRLAARLVDAGHRVFGLARSDSSAKRMEEMGLTAVHGDLAVPRSVQGALDEANPRVVAHLAAEIATQRNAERIRRVNIDGTRALAEACRGRGLSRFLFLSSVVVGMPGGQLLTEDGPLEATTVYGQSKVDGERLLQSEQQSHELALAILRPSHIYGVGGWFGNIVRDLKRRTFLIPGNGENLWDVVHVDDVVAACEALLFASAEKLGDGLYHVADDTPVTFNDFIGETCRLMGRKPPWHAPVGVARIVAGRGPVDAAIRSARSSNQKLRERLGWEPKYPEYRQGLAVTLPLLT